MTVIDAVIRLVPGVLGDEESSVSDSFSGSRRWLGVCPIHAAAGVSRPEVPPVLLSGDHEEIARWREKTPASGPGAAEDLLERGSRPKSEKLYKLTNGEIRDLPLRD